MTIELRFIDSGPSWETPAAPVAAVLTAGRGRLSGADSRQLDFGSDTGPSRGSCSADPVTYNISGNITIILAESEAACVQLLDGDSGRKM